MAGGDDDYQKRSRESIVLCTIGFIGYITYHIARMVSKSKDFSCIGVVADRGKTADWIVTPKTYSSQFLEKFYI